MKRMSAKQAMEHPWIKEGMQEDASFHHGQNTSTVGRQREEDEEGAKAIALEESPKKVLDKPKISLGKVLQFHVVP